MRRAAVLLALAFAAAACSWKKPYLTLDDLDRDLPRRSFDEACASLPPPSVDGAFLFAADIEDLDSHAIVGTIRVTVEAATYEGASVWYVDALTEDTVESETVHDTMYVDSDLGIRWRQRVAERCLPDGSVQTDASHVEPLTIGLQRSRRALPFTLSKDGRRDHFDSPQPRGTAVVTLPGALLFFRNCDAEPAMYVNPHRAPDHFTLRRDGDALTCGVPGAESWTIHLSATDRTVLGIDEFRFERSRRRYVVRATPR